MFPVRRQKECELSPRGLAEACRQAPWPQGAAVRQARHLVSPAFPPSVPTPVGEDSFPTTPAPRLTALGKRTKGNLWFHKSGVEYLLFVMNPALMSLIKADSAIYHMSLVHQGNGS